MVIPNNVCKQTNDKANDKSTPTIKRTPKRYKPPFLIALPRLCSVLETYSQQFSITCPPRSNPQTHKDINYNIIFPKPLRQGSKSRSSFQTVIPPILTMLFIIIFDIVTPYIHFTIESPLHFYKKNHKKTCLKKRGLPLKLLL